MRAFLVLVVVAGLAIASNEAIDDGIVDHVFTENSLVEAASEGKVYLVDIILMDSTTTSDINSALDQAYTNGYFDIIKMIMNSITNSQLLSSTADRLLIRVVADIIIPPLSKKGIRSDVILLCVPLSSTAIRNSCRSFSQNAQDSQTLTLLDAYSKSTSEINRKSLDSSQVGDPCNFDQDHDTVTIDGEGSWDMYIRCRDNISVQSSPTLIITNTGNFPPPLGLFVPLAGVQTRTEHLIIRNSPSLSDVPPQTFIGLDSVTTLTLSNLGIETLYRNSFFGLRNLRHLDLSYNYLSEVPVYNRRMKYLPSLTSMDITGNHLIRGCTPLRVQVVPDNQLPPCRGHGLLLKQIAQAGLQNGHRYTKIPSQDLERRFVCSTNPGFLEQEIRHVYKLRRRSNTHYGLVFMFDNGMMLSELTTRKYYFNHIKSTCTRVNIKQLLEKKKDLSLEILASLMFTLHSPLWRHLLGEMTMEEYLHRYQSFVIEDMNVPEHSITGADTLTKVSEYEIAHPYFKESFVDSCITFAHMMFRDLLSY